MPPGPPSILYNVRFHYHGRTIVSARRHVLIFVMVNQFVKLLHTRKERHSTVISSGSQWNMEKVLLIALRFNIKIHRYHIQDTYSEFG